MAMPNNRSQRTQRVRFVYILSQGRGAAAAERWSRLGKLRRSVIFVDCATY